MKKTMIKIKSKTRVAVLAALIVFASASSLALVMKMGGIFNESARAPRVVETTDPVIDQNTGNGIISISKIDKPFYTSAGSPWNNGAISETYIANCAAGETLVDCALDVDTASGQHTWSNLAAFESIRVYRGNTNTAKKNSCAIAFSPNQAGMGSNATLNAYCMQNNGAIYKIDKSFSTSAGSPWNNGAISENYIANCGNGDFLINCALDVDTAAGQHTWSNIQISGGITLYRGNTNVAKQNSCAIAFGANEPGMGSSATLNAYCRKSDGSISKVDKNFSTSAGSPWNNGAIPETYIANCAAGEVLVDCGLDVNTASGQHTWSNLSAFNGINIYRGNTNVAKQNSCAIAFGPNEPGMGSNATLNAYCMKTTTGGGGGGNNLLTISKSGTGTGKVISNTGGIDCISSCVEFDTAITPGCEAKCKKSFSNGQQITLTATPDAKYTFLGWSGDCSGSSNTCTLTMNGDKKALAMFRDEKFATPCSAGVDYEYKGNIADYTSNTPPISLLDTYDSSKLYKMNPTNNGVGHYVAYLKGNYQERGRAQGYLFGTQIAERLRDFFGCGAYINQPKLSKVAFTFDDVAEMNGMLEGMNQKIGANWANYCHDKPLDLNMMKLLQVEGDDYVLNGAAQENVRNARNNIFCSGDSFSYIYTKSGKPVAYRNLDYPLHYNSAGNPSPLEFSENYHAIFVVEPAGGQKKYINIAKVGHIGVVTGINQDGLFLGIDSAAGSNFVNGGTTGIMLQRQIIEKTSTLSQAASLAKSQKVFSWLPTIIDKEDNGVLELVTPANGGTTQIRESWPWTELASGFSKTAGVAHNQNLYVSSKNYGINSKSIPASDIENIFKSLYNLQEETMNDLIMKNGIQKIDDIVAFNLNRAWYNNAHKKVNGASDCNSTEQSDTAADTLHKVSFDSATMNFVVGFGDNVRNAAGLNMGVFRYNFNSLFNYVK